MPKTDPKKSRRKNKKPFVFLCSCCAAVFLLFLSAQNLRPFSDSRVLGTQDEVVEEDIGAQITFWEDFLAITPTYFDGWLELSSLLASSGNDEAAWVALNKAKEINPNSEKLTEAGELLK